MFSSRAEAARQFLNQFSAQRRSLAALCVAKDE